jgi:hemoglobin
MPGPEETLDPDTVYGAVGGMAFFERLVDAFYDRVERDEPLVALYPNNHDLGPARMRLRLFLAQYWGGPTTYSDQRGHPRLRMRHVPFAIDADARDRWLAAMNGALDEVAPPPEVDAAMRDYFAMAADAMRNR